MVFSGREKLKKCNYCRNTKDKWLTHEDACKHYQEARKALKFILTRAESTDIEPFDPRMIAQVCRRVVGMSRI